MGARSEVAQQIVGRVKKLGGPKTHDSLPTEERPHSREGRETASLVAQNRTGVKSFSWMSNWLPSAKATRKYFEVMFSSTTLPTALREAT